MSKNQKIRISLILMSMITFTLSNCASVEAPNRLRKTIDLQGHRGARGLKPENTWPAFEEAIKYKMVTLELDTVLTKDKRIVIHHDSDTNPIICQNANGNELKKISLYELTLAELQSYDCGSKKNPNFPKQIPVPGTKLLSLEEFFEKVLFAEKKSKEAFEFNIETKFPDDGSAPDNLVKEHTEKLIQIIEKYKVVERSTIQSFDLRTLTFSKTKNAKIKTSALFVPTYFQGFLMTIGLGNGYRETILSAAKDKQADIISPYFLYVTPKFVKESHERGMFVIPWTVNTEKEMKRLVSCGVDGIISDYPDLLDSVVRPKP
ncbi:glycerophosphoryl diester phosphodiesterase [Leptospira meyeri]|uniref:Glycerophosphoryl diester phosphodiesterase n=1 Tax=Leptospira meyeri TaxID=29508 RepID=A0A4R8MV57_LEPME|nr:glycerophosphodiester phosphodiesterase [Leptospira meyeri]EKJ88045.1 glycerophosphodiester phosphodiesterase family protein [Leptospira meyeri serovar Hardjo str. Went 5]TDY73283.1 glycerophosphoryl diester phosphodiesterase [Leptospira meyeri]